MKTRFERSVQLFSRVSIFLYGLALLDFLLHPLEPDYNFNSIIFRAVSVLVLAPLTILIGFLIIRRVPGNIVGPLLLVWSGSVIYGSIRSGIGPVPFALFYYYDLAFGWFALFLMILHYPGGKIYPPGVTPWIYRLLGINILLNTLIFLSTKTLQVPAQIANPFYLPVLQQQADLILRLGLLFFSPLLVLALISPILRYRKGSHLERQQIKWLAAFAGSSVIYIILALIGFPLLTGAQVMNPGNNFAAVFFYIAAGLVPPAAIGIAVLRYRLWDIDILIRRTLLYSILSVLLAVVFYTSITILQSLFVATTQQQSPISIVLSTLAIAALFNPLRRRLQDLIDRRFYRSKYNTEQAIAEFAAFARNQTDLQLLTQELQVVVQTSMQPTHLDIWMRSSARQKATKPR